MTGPTWRERLKPLELVAMAGVLAVFTGGISLAGTRQIDLAAIFAGIAFIAALLVLSMLALASGGAEEGSIDGPVLDRHDGPAPEQPDAEAPAAQPVETDAAPAEQPGAESTGTEPPAADPR